MCFAVVVGRKASVDGSVIFGHSEQNCGRAMVHYRRIPRIENPNIRLRGGATLSVSRSWSFLWTEAPGLEFSDNCFNEWGVAIACNGCPTKEDSLPEVTARKEIIDGGVGHMLPRLVAMQARTAREAVEVAAGLIDRYGYTGEGRTLTVADKTEAWVMSIVRGRHYLAVRVPDDMVAVIPNRHVIGEVENLADLEQVICSPDLVSYATKRGWYSPEDGPFNFQTAYAGAAPGSMEEQSGVCSRQWNGQALISGNRAPLPPTGPLPFTVKAERQLAVADVAAVLRSHLDGTEFDLAPLHVSGSPHEIATEIDNSFARCACNIATQESVIWQLRSSLPTEIGCVAWRATGVPCSSVYTPWYACVSAIPAVFNDGADSTKAMSLEHHFHPDDRIWQPSADHIYWTWQRVAKLIDERYEELAPLVKADWQMWERSQFDRQEKLEAMVSKLFTQDRELGVSFLTDYSVGQALVAWQQAQELLGRLSDSNA